VKRSPREWNEATVVAEIRRIHRKRESLAWSKAPVQLRKAGEYRFGSWARAVAAAGIDYKTVRIGRTYTDSELISWLRKTARARPEMTLVELDGVGPLRALKSHFGSWQKAVERAGLRDWPKRQKQRWTKPAIIQRLRELYGSGQTANADERVYKAATAHFGSLAAAAKRAGIEVNVPRFWTKQELVTTLRQIARKHGQISHAAIVKARALDAVRKHFGGIEQAARKLGVDSHATKRTRAHAELDDRRESLKRLRALAKQLKRPVTAVDIHPSLRDALLRNFGTIEKARKAAGLPDPAPHRKWDYKRALSELRDEHRRGTRLTLRGLIRAKRKDLAHAITEHVGSLPRARRLAGVPEPEELPRRHQPFVKVWDADRVLDEILQRAERGQSLAPTRVPTPLYDAAMRYLGSWREAIEAAGFEYSAVVLNRPFDDGELLAILRRLSVEQPTMTLTELQHQPIATSLHRWYGGVHSALRAAGLRHWPVRMHFPRMPRERVRTALQQRIAQALPIDRVSVTTDDGRLAYAVKMIHPDWTEALRRLELGRPSRVRSRSRKTR
jgi:hypothetical protein